ncbi:hypothetical protein ACFFWD_33570 [Bradyrhizobium erythrophlei]|uniref:hypothetical protein n=1 Tax=Bradyrhizobium erythrophlei TaxID=1437360 RepID=UPI0035E6EDF6
MFQVAQLRNTLADLRIGISFATIRPSVRPTLWTMAMARLAIKQIGEQTADMLGAFEQLAETAILLMAASILHSNLQL